MFNKKGRVIYFSRASVNFSFQTKKLFFFCIFKDLSIVSFKKQKALLDFSKFKMGRLEKIAKLIELLRSLENNQSNKKYKLLVSKSKISFSVDVNDDLLKAINEMPKNPIRKKY